MMGLVVGVLLLAIFGAAWVYACSAPKSRFFRPVLIHGPKDGHNAALTFDDGPAPPFTEQILDILAERKIPATFFLCGKNVERYPEIARRIVREGHAIGNHTYSHPLLYLHTSRFMAEEIDRTQDVIERVTGVKPVLFRPPYGARWPGLMPILKARGLKMVMWSATGYDWKYQTEQIVRSATRGMHSGAIILLHDGHERRAPGEIDRSSTVKALPFIIAAAASADLTFVSLESFMP